jgi:hypothetical protein
MAVPSMLCFFFKKESSKKNMSEKNSFLKFKNQNSKSFKWFFLFKIKKTLKFSISS